MTIDVQQEHFEQFVESMRQIMFRKGNDYANTDRLSNFKLAGAICQMTAEQNCLSLIATKVARLGVLLEQNHTKPLNESIDDTLTDLANYAVLLSAIRADRAAEENPTVKVRMDTDAKLREVAPKGHVFRKKANGING